MTTNRWGRFIGVVGAVLLGFGVLGTWAIGGFQNLVFLFNNSILVIHLALGLLALIAWLGLTRGAALSSPKDLFWGRSARYGYNAFSSTVVVVGLLVLANFYAGQFNRRWDFTEEGVYSLQPQTIEVIKNLKKPLKLVSVKGLAAVNDEETKRILDLYQYHNPSKVTLESFSPKAKPNLVKQYDFKPGNVLAIVYGEGKEANTSRVNDISEEAITNGILKLSKGDSKKVYFLTGHEEVETRDQRNRTGASRFRDSLVDQNFKVDDLLLSTLEKVPDDAAAVIVLAPKKELRSEEKSRLIKYVEQGGHLILLSDPRTTGDIKEIAAHFKIDVGENVVLDKFQTIFGSGVGAEPIVRDYIPTGIAKDFSAAQPTVFNLASTVRKASDVPTDATYTEFLKSSASAWAETNLSMLLDSEEAIAVKEDGDQAGPVSMGVSYEKKVKVDGSSEERTARLVVVGDSDWVGNSYFGATGFFNRELALSMINWSSGEESAVTIRKGKIKASQMPLTEDIAKAILIAILVIPELILLFGLSIWWKRRTAYA